MAKYITHSDTETEALGQRMGGAVQKPMVFALYGGMGMGKTALIRGMVKGLGSGDRVNSPTFALVHEYSGRLPVYHFDMYRVTGWDDLYSTGFFDYLDNGVLLVEWSENIEEDLPQDAVKIEISRGEGDCDRVIETDWGEF